jgi:hypothetical protein
MLAVLATLLWQPQRQEQASAGYTAICLMRVKALSLVALSISLVSYVRCYRRGKRFLLFAIFCVLGATWFPVVIYMSMLPRLKPDVSDELSLMGYRPSRGEHQASTSSLFVIRRTRELGCAELYAAPMHYDVDNCCKPAQTSSLLLMAQLVAQSTVIGYFIIDRSCVRITVRRFIFASF